MSLFFFSSRRRHTRCLSDWSSDVCSSDLGTPGDDVITLTVDVDDPNTLVINDNDVIKIGRASCRERVSMSDVAEFLRKKRRRTYTTIRNTRRHGVMTTHELQLNNHE